MMRVDEAGIREVRAVAERYVEAVFKGDVETLKACFHQSAAMAGYLGDELLTGGPGRFFEDMAATPSMESTAAPYAAEITSVEVVGGAASLRIDETGFFGSLSFSNWFHLVKGDDGAWSIVSKLFAMRTDEGGG